MVRHCRFVTLLAAIAVSSAYAGATCKFHLNSVTPCDKHGKPCVPKLGDETYGVLVSWKVVGRPDSPYKVAFSIAHKKSTTSPVIAEPGQYSYYCTFNLPLDGEIPYSIKIDSEGVSGAVPGLEAIEGSFTPQPPSTAVQYFAPRSLQAGQTLTVTPAPNSKFNWIGTILAAPTSDGFQTVLSYSPPPGFRAMAADPAGYPCVAGYIDSPTNVFTVRQSFTARVSNCVVDVKKADFEWSDLGSKLPQNVQHYVRDEVCVPLSDPAIAAFVAANLRADFRTKMTPLQAARVLFQAVARTLTYRRNPPDNKAAGVLQRGVGDCLCMTNLYIACLRSIGIPARALCGWIENDDWHCWSELYSPKAGWIPQDVTYCNSNGRGEYATYFAVMPDLNKRVAVCRGGTFVLAGYTYEHLQVGASPSQGSGSITRTYTHSLKPLG